MQRKQDQDSVANNFKCHIFINQKKSFINVVSRILSLQLTWSPEHTYEFLVANI